MTRLIVITGAPGSGKSTLVGALRQSLGVPVISRDEMKTEYLAARGIGHAAAGPEANREVTAAFFQRLHAAVAEGSTQILAEAAFQAPLWVQGLQGIAADVCFVVLEVPVDERAARIEARAKADPHHVYVHGIADVRAAEWVGPDFGERMVIDGTRPVSEICSAVIQWVQCKDSRSAHPNHGSCCNDASW